MYSLSELQSTPTQICEFIIKLTKIEIAFSSIDDNLYFDNINFLEIYPKVFEMFKIKS